VILKPNHLYKNIQTNYFFFVLKWICKGFYEIIDDYGITTITSVKMNGEKEWWFMPQRGKPMLDKEIIKITL
jgi:hypothetical protein